MKSPEFKPIIPLNNAVEVNHRFPLHCLPHAIKDYVQSVAASTETSPEMCAHACLGVIAAAVQRKYTVHATGSYNEPLSFLGVIIANPGERKSAVIHAATSILHEEESRLNCESASMRAERNLFRQRLMFEIRKLEKKSATSEEDISAYLSLQKQLEEFPEISPVRLICDDSTPEALTSLLAEQGGRIAIVSAEGGVFETISGRFNRLPTLDPYLKGHSGDDIIVDRKGRGSEKVTSPALSMIVATQPTVMESVMSNDTFCGRGLLARFIYCFPESRIGKRKHGSPAIDNNALTAYEACVRELLRIPMPDHPHLLTLSPSASTVFGDFFEKHEQYLVSEGFSMADWAAKFPGLVLRLAGLLHLATSAGTSSIIEESTMVDAIEIGKLYLSHAAYAYSGRCDCAEKSKAAFLLSKIRNSGVTEMKRSELFRMARGRYFKQSSDISRPLEILEDRNYIRLKEQVYSGVGRPPDTVIVFNPQIWNKRME